MKIGAKEVCKKSVHEQSENVNDKRVDEKRNLYPALSPETNQKLLTQFSICIPIPRALQSFQTSSV